MWPLINQLEHSLSTILTSRCRIVIEGEYKASRPGDRLPLAMLRASAQQAGTLSALEILLHSRAVPACAVALSGKPSWTNQLPLWRSSYGGLDLRGTNSDPGQECGAMAMVVSCQNVQQPRATKRRPASPTRLTSPCGRRSCVPRLCGAAYEWSIAGDEDCRRLCQRYAERFLSRGN
jgi:hypothetical protein